MSDEREFLPGDVLEERELWCVQTRLGEGYPWVDYGTQLADPFAILRVYDYRTEHHADVQVRIAKVDVKIAVEDPERLRELMEEKKKRKGWGTASALNS